MLPKSIEDIIIEYMEQMNAVTDLPSIAAVKRLIRRTDVYVCDSLAMVLGLPCPDTIRLRYRILLAQDFFFYFRLAPMQRLRLLHLLESGIQHHRDLSRVVWLFVLRQPSLSEWPEYRQLFTDSLFLKMIRHLRSRYSFGMIP